MREKHRHRVLDDERIFASAFASELLNTGPYKNVWRDVFLSGNARFSALNSTSTD